MSRSKRLVESACREVVITGIRKKKLLCLGIALLRLYQMLTFVLGDNGILDGWCLLLVIPHVLVSCSRRAQVGADEVLDGSDGEGGRPLRRRKVKNLSQLQCKKNHSPLFGTTGLQGPRA